MISRLLLVGLLLAPLRVGLAQDTTAVTPPPSLRPAADSARCGFCHRASVPLAIFEGFLVNAVVNRLNVWVLKDSLYEVTPHSWKTNLRRGWDFDKDDSLVNMLGHPYQGSTYFAAARDNGLGFWAGAPLTFFHSVVWEYFGETTQASINDLVDTGLGGIALGEMFHRVAATIRNNEQGGGGRTLPASSRRSPSIRSAASTGWCAATGVARGPTRRSITRWAPCSGSAAASASCAGPARS